MVCGIDILTCILEMIWSTRSVLAIPLKIGFSRKFLGEILPSYLVYREAKCTGVTLIVFSLYICCQTNNFRRKEDGSHHGTTWKVKFSLDNVDRRNTYKLRIALASATLAELQVTYKIDISIGCFNF